MSSLNPKDNKFHQGNKSDGKHYWLTPVPLMLKLMAEHDFDFDACPYPKPKDFDGLTCEWGQSTYANPPFGSIIHEGKKKGPTAWMRKAIEENKKGKRVVIVYPVDKWILMMIEAGAKISNLGDVRWEAIEDGTVGKGTGRHIAKFVLEPNKQAMKESMSLIEYAEENGIGKESFAHLLLNVHINEDGQGIVSIQTALEALVIEAKHIRDSQDYAKDPD